MSDEIQIEPRVAEASLGLPAGAVVPVLTNVPVTHRGRKIGTAEVDQSGHVIMTITNEFDKEGIWRMLANQETRGLSLGTSDG
jgi:hypothetical protein